MKKAVKEYFTFSRKERKAAIALLLLTGIFIVLPYVYPVPKTTVPVNNELQQQIAALQTGDRSLDTGYQKENTRIIWEAPPAAYTLFLFDPNTLDSAGWRKLGIREKTTKTILNYRNKGGQFRQPDDIRKIWGLMPAEANRIIPYVRITEVKDKYPYYSNNPGKPVVKPTVVDINTASVDQLKILPGMDYSMPYRIIKYKERLGGFISIEQVKETFGMTDSVFHAIQPFLTIGTPTLRKLNINTATDYELSYHPYIGRDIGKAIVIYRQVHGNYQSVEDLRKIIFLKEDVLQKMAPYLTTE